MTDRFSRGRKRLMTHEQNLIEHKEQAKRLGYKLPEDSVKIPKIGEWALSPISTEPVFEHVKQPSIPKTARSPRHQPNVDAVYRIRPPKQIIDDPMQLAQTARTKFPMGATSTDLDVIMRSRVRTPKVPLPPLQGRTQDDMEPFLPLEIFDDSTFSQYSIEELLKYPRAFSKYTDLEGNVKWDRCECINYDPSNELFQIRWDKSGKVKKVPRYNIRFEIENEEKFNQRVENAKRSCHRWEMRFRFDNRVKQMQKEDAEGLSQNTKDMIEQKGNFKAEGIYKNRLYDLYNENENNFKNVNTQLEFIYDLEYNPLLPDRDDFLELFEKKEGNWKYGLVFKPEYSFLERLNLLEDNFLFNKEYILFAIQKVSKVFQENSGALFLDGTVTGLISLDEFITVQKTTTKLACTEFKKAVDFVIDSCFSDIVQGKECPTDERSLNALFQRITNLIQRIKHQVLSDVILNSLDTFAKLFKRYIDFEGAVPPKPLFNIKLHLSDENKIILTPTIDEFRTEIEKIYDFMIDEITKISFIEVPITDVDMTQVSFSDCITHILGEKEKMKTVFEALYKKLTDVVDFFLQTEKSIGIDPISFVMQFDPDGKKSLEEYGAQLKSLYEDFDICQNKLDVHYELGMFDVDSESLKTISVENIDKVIIALLTQLKRHAVSETESYTKILNEIVEKVLKEPETPEELISLKEYIAEIKSQKKDRTAKLETTLKRYDFLVDNKFNINDEDCAKLFEMRKLPNSINNAITTTEAGLGEKTKIAIKALRESEVVLDKEAKELLERISPFVEKFQDIEMTVEAADIVTEMQGKLTDLRRQHDRYMRQEALFDFEPGPNKTIEKLVEEFVPLYTMWVLASDWLRSYTSWLDLPFNQVRSDTMNAFVVQGSKKVQKLRKDISKYPALVKNVLTPLGEQIEEFKGHIPLISKLRHPGIKTKHWEMISKVVGFKVNPTIDMTLTQFIGLDLERWTREITDISNVAAQEFNLESTLDGMDSELEQLIFGTSMFRDTKVYILSDVNDIISKIDDQLVTTQTLMTSPFIATVKKRATEYLQFLRHAHETLDAWAECQRGWLYLQPIFTGTSIQQKLHAEARDWTQVDKTWKSLMDQTHIHPQFKTVMLREGIYEDLQRANKLLDSITQGLNAYLESKRLGFPRFFFLSNDELISILSHTKDFDHIQKNMNKLFEYVQTITVDGTNITHINDDGLESVKFTNPVDGDTAEIEEWLTNFEKEMQNTLKYYIKESIPAAALKKREEWINDFPAQVILTTNQILWTTQVTKALTTNGLSALLDEFLKQLDNLTALIRKPLSSATRQCISCLLILEVHNRDIIQHLIDDHITSTEEFKWQQQLRYYWENETVMVRSINNDYEYSYEYAGNSARLVITPLTDRCYQTLLAAFKQNMSGAPSGPAGTGKTETVRDCAKALGRPCVVYNCSEEVTPEQMSQFFAGLSSSGTWSCFDEFNRINIEVLSVIAQQVRSIQEAIATHQETFQLDARKLKLNENAAICITMNPGYAGRTELPDNLKALFRPCAMMVPDFVFISEILLFSGGYATASSLSVKLVALFDLCRKQLSNAYHYDWGLRAMKAILSTAGKAKRNNLDAQEALLLFESIRDCTRPRLVDIDIPLFEGIMHDVFPEVKTDKIIDQDMNKLMRESYVELHAQPLDLYVLKCNEIYETTLVRHGIMFVGGSMGGKSLAWKALQKTLGKLADKGIGKKCTTFNLNPKAISIPELYGLFDPVTSGWSDGVLSSFIRDCSMAEPTEWNWIIVDGPVDSLWIETMNSLLDDNKVLCLSNNERISLGAHVKMMFEVDDLSQASPATVSRCGMIYFDPITLPWEAIADSWVTDNLEERGEVVKHVRKLMDKYVPKMVQFVQRDGKVMIGSNPMFFVKNMIKLINPFFDIMRKSIEIPAIDGEDPKSIDPLDHSLFFSRYSKKGTHKFGYFNQEALNQVFEMVLIFSMVWSFGAVLSEDSRSVFNNFIRELLQKEKSIAQFPTKDTCFDYFIDFEKKEWAPWVDGELGIEYIPKDELETFKKKPVERIFIPTSESAAMTFITRLLLEHQTNVLFHGPESSKTITIQNLFQNVLPKKYDCKNLPIANCSTANGILNVMKSFMHKHHGNLGPLVDQQLVIFLDNIGSVKPEIYGAQPPLELIRQFCDYGGWYNTSNVTFQKVVDTTLVAAMGPAGSGLFSIPERLMRHFNLFHTPKMKIPAMEKVIRSIIKAKFTGFDESISELFGKTVDAFIDIHKQCIENMLPIPSKLHYIFSLRNIVRVLKGMLLVKPSDLPDDNAWCRLFYNEMMREYSDRFNTYNDRTWFTDTMNKTIEKRMGKKFEEFCPKGRIMFNEFADRAGRYKEIVSRPPEVLQVCREMLEDHNRDASKQLDIVIFDEAVDHISNLNRILSMERGHAMLVGVKSSGRKSLARLSLHTSGMDIFEIQITRTYDVVEWHEDIKNLMKGIGLNDQPTGFIISDAQIVGNFQLEDISNLLINGEVPNLFEREEREQIIADLINNEMLTDSDPWGVFINRCKKHLHIILVFSPYGTTFKDSILSFSALRTETTIDWYMPWSRNALESVAYAAFQHLSIGDKEAVKSVVNVCVEIHKSVEAESERFFKETKRFTACTPSRYFELLNNFADILTTHQEETDSNIGKYVGGVEKITSTRAQISILSDELDAAIPFLENKKKQVELMLVDLQKKQKEVETTKLEVKKQADIAEEEEKKASEKNEIAQGKLAEAQPILQKAQDAVDSMDKNSLVSIKTMKKISPALRETFESICIIFQRAPRKIDGPVPGQKIEDYWPETLTLLNDVKFINNIKNFKPEELPKSVIDKLKKYVPAGKRERDKKEGEVAKGSKAVSNLYLWVCATYDYWWVYQTIIPVEMEAKAALEKLQESQKQLAESKAYLQSVEDQLAGLQRTFDDAKAQEKELADNVACKQLRLDRAQKIMSGLSGETTRWEQCADDLKKGSEFLLGDSLLAGASITNLAAFSPSFRHDLIDKWKGFLSHENIKFTETFTIEKSLGNDPTIRDWVVKGLPNDTHSIENAIIISNSKQSFPLLIDPQLSGTKWLRNVIGEKLAVLRFDQNDFLQRLKSCVSFGVPVLIENVTLKLDPIIEPILSKEIISIDGAKTVTLGGESVQYNDDFRLYLSTKYPNPHYSPEVCSQVTLVNFTTTQDGLSDLLMNNLIEVERSDLDKERIKIMEANAANMMKLKEIESEILHIVSNAGSDILEDDTAIDTLQRAQHTSANIAGQMAASEKTEKQIAAFRKQLSPVSERAALLYFCASNFQVVDPMYQFSLKWFISIFKNALQSADHPSDTKALIVSLQNAIAKAFYESVSFSLFSRHKMLFSTLMAIRILCSEGKINSPELAFLLAPSVSKEKNPYKWLPNEIWSLVSVLPSVNPVFQALVDSLKTREDDWIKYYKSNTPEVDSFPFKEQLSLFQQLLILRVFHLHRVREGLRIFVSESLGKEFMSPPPLNLGKIFKESSPLSPLIFIITPGIDPQDEIIQVAKSMDLDKYLKSYSLGRGRGAGAEELLEEAADKGFWVLLQNCHLSLSWMPKLEHIIDNLDPEKVNSRFRLCLVTMSSPDFPIGILYQGSKLIYEIPKGIRENMLRVYSGMNADDYINEYSTIERKLTFHLSFFHAVVLERIQFGSIGWNIPYEFNPSDLAISRKHLSMFLGQAKSEKVPYESLGYVIGELNYGGRVTDKWDRRLLLTLLSRYFSPQIEKKDFTFGSSYPSPSFDDPLDKVEKIISQWPITTEGSDVGLSENASTITARNEALNIFNSLVEIQPTLVAASGNSSEEEFALKLVENLIKEVPQTFNVFNFKKKFDLTDTINTVLHHEIILYNKLIEFIQGSLTKLQRGLKGLIVMDEELELLNRRILSNKIPEAWLVYSFPSILTLHAYMDDLNKRVDFLNKWVCTERPAVFKIGAFFHPEEFLTAVLQVYARKHVVPFDSLTWATTIQNTLDEKKFTKPPEEGIYIQGLYLEGAKWDMENGKLIECEQKELIANLPIVHLMPTQNKNLYDMSKTFECTMYRTQNRGSGAMGLPNYIMSLFIPTTDVSPEHWIERSVAVFITVQN